MSTPAPVKSRDFVKFEQEHRLAKRLGLGGVLVGSLFDGATDADGRRERLRRAILARGPAVVCEHKNGREITYAQAFEQLYGESP